MNVSLLPSLRSVVFLVCSLACAACAGPIDYSSRYYEVGFSRGTPGFSNFRIDGLGKGKLGVDSILKTDAPTNSAWVFRTLGPNRFGYFTNEKDEEPVWEIRCKGNVMQIASRHAASAQPQPFRIVFDQKANHATLLGMMKPGERKVSVPCVLHLPDSGSVRITSNLRADKIDYDARRFVRPAYVEVSFPPATRERKKVEYKLEFCAIHPRVNDPGTVQLDGFRRGFLNMFQVNPRMQMLANNASSDAVTFTLFKYSEMALYTPPLADGLTCLDLVRMTLDRYLSGVKGYGQTGYVAGFGEADLIPWPTPFTTSDTHPSVLISACNYIKGSKDTRWAKENYRALMSWAQEMLATDRDGNGLIEYPTSGNYGDRPVVNRRPSNWWDTINFGHEDAYANALAYRACAMLADLADSLGETGDSGRLRTAAKKLRSAYGPAFLNPKTGVLAGWRSQDGSIHDYWFTFVNGIAVTYGLLEPTESQSVMDRLLDKMTEVGYTNFHLGLPGNLVPVRKGDYALHDTPPQVHGVPQLEDGSDGFQYYENGGATGCFAYFTLKALYNLGRVEDARRILYPMLESYEAGHFQGFCADGLSKDWRDWSGGCHGYEGLLVDNYLPLLAVFDDLKVKPAKARHTP